VIAYEETRIRWVENSTGARAFNMTTEFIKLAGRVILWKIRALALYMAPDEYHHGRLRGRGC
jgi:hypothetical protein